MAMRRLVVGNPTSPARRRWEHLAPFVLAVSMVIAGLLSFRHGQDFGVYWRAARRLVHGEPLYPVSDGFLAYRYAPGAALFFVPLAALPLVPAKAIWYSLIFAAVLYVARSLKRFSPGPRATLAVTAAFLAIARPIIEELNEGQVNLVVLAIILAAFAAEDNSRRVRPGLLAAAAAGLKIAPGILALEWLVRRRWLAAFSAFVGLVGIAAIPAAFYGAAGAMRENASLIASITFASQALMVTHPASQSVFAVLGRLGLPPQVGSAAAIALAVAALSAPDLPRRRALLVLWMPLGSTFGAIQNFVFALPAAYLLAMRGRAHAWLVLALGLPQVVLLYDVVGPSAERWAWDHSAMGIPMLALFVLVRWPALGRANDTPAVAPTNPVPPAPGQRSFGLRAISRRRQPAATTSKRERHLEAQDGIGIEIGQLHAGRDVPRPEADPHARVRA